MITDHRDVLAVAPALRLTLQFLVGSDPPRKDGLHFQKCSFWFYFSCLFLKIHCKTCTRTCLCLFLFVCPLVLSDCIIKLVIEFSVTAGWTSWPSTSNPPTGLHFRLYTATTASSHEQPGLFVHLWPAELLRVKQSEPTESVSSADSDSNSRDWKIRIFVDRVVATVNIQY